MKNLSTLILFIVVPIIFVLMIAQSKPGEGMAIALVLGIIFFISVVIFLVTRIISAGVASIENQKFGNLSVEDIKWQRVQKFSRIFSGVIALISLISFWMVMTTPLGWSSTTKVMVYLPILVIPIMEGFFMLKKSEKQGKTIEKLGALVMIIIPAAILAVWILP